MANSNLSNLVLNTQKDNKVFTYFNKSNDNVAAANYFNNNWTHFKSGDIIEVINDTSINTYKVVSSNNKETSIVVIDSGGGGGSGTVTSVNELLPDGNGNVQIMASNIEVGTGVTIKDALDTEQEARIEKDNELQTEIDTKTDANEASAIASNVVESHNDDVNAHQAIQAAVGGAIASAVSNHNSDVDAHQPLQTGMTNAITQAIENHNQNDIAHKNQLDDMKDLEQDLLNRIISLEQRGSYLGSFSGDTSQQYINKNFDEFTQTPQLGDFVHVIDDQGYNSVWLYVCDLLDGDVARFVKDIELSTDITGKLDRSAEISKLYGTDGLGAQMLYSLGDVSRVHQVNSKNPDGNKNVIISGDDIKIDGTGYNTNTVHEEINLKLNKTTEASKIYATDESGEQTLLGTDEVGKVDNIKINSKLATVIDKVATMNIDGRDIYQNYTDTTKGKLTENILDLQNYKTNTLEKDEADDGLYYRQLKDGAEAWQKANEVSLSAQQQVFIDNTSWKVVGRKYLNNVQLTINKKDGGVGSVSEVVITNLPDGWRPTDMVTQVYPQWTESNKTFINLTMQVRSNGNVVAVGDQSMPDQHYFSGNIVLNYITQNTDFANIMSIKTKDFTSELNVPANVIVKACINEMTGLVNIQGEVATNANPSGIIIPLKYRPVANYGNGAWRIYHNASEVAGKVARVSKTDGTLKFYQSGTEVNYAWSAGAGSFDITYYAEQTDSALVLNNDLYDYENAGSGCEAWYDKVAQKVYYKITLSGNLSSGSDTVLATFNKDWAKAVTSYLYFVCKASGTSNDQKLYINTAGQVRYQTVSTYIWTGIYTAVNSLGIGKTKIIQRVENDTAPTLLATIPFISGGNGAQLRLFTDGSGVLNFGYVNLNGSANNYVTITAPAAFTQLYEFIPLSVTGCAIAQSGSSIDMCYATTCTKTSIEFWQSGTASKSGGFTFKWRYK